MEILFPHSGQENPESGVYPFMHEPQIASYFSLFVAVLQTTHRGGNNEFLSISLGRGITYLLYLNTQKSMVK